MPDIEKEIQAVKFLLASFFDDPPEVERKKAITKKAAENEYVKVNARLPEKRLQEQLWFLQAKLNGIILLDYAKFYLTIFIGTVILIKIAQQLGGIFNLWYRFMSPQIYFAGSDSQKQA